MIVRFFDHKRESPPKNRAGSLPVDGVSRTGSRPVENGLPRGIEVTVSLDRLLLDRVVYVMNVV